MRLRFRVFLILRRLFDYLPCVVVAWGVLAIGGVYPWAYYPLLGAAFASGAFELWLGRAELVTGPVRLVGGALVLVASATAAQMIPLPFAVRQAISPSTDEFLKQYVVGYAATVTTANRPLSIDAGATLVALIFVVALGVFLLGLIVRVGRRGADDLVLTVTLVGALIAVASLIQRASGTERVYGIWQPQLSTAAPYGPFVNRNHFAGWMLMALPLVLGSGLSRLHGPRKHGDARRALVWLGSSEGSWVLLVAGVAAIMGLTLAMSLSRSGVVTMSIIVAVLCGGILASGVKRRKVSIAYGVFFLAVAFGWGGTSALGARFADADSSVRRRVAVWQDAASVARKFPIAGTGLNTYGTSMLLFQTADPAHHYAQAHNDYLQLAAEGGMLVGLPALLWLAVLVKGLIDRVKRSGLEPATAGAIAGIVAILLQETADFSLQMPGNAVLFCVLCAAALRDASVESKCAAVAGTESGRGAWYNAVDTKPARMLQCPACRSMEIHRSRSTSTWERWRKTITKRRPYRCHTCGWRGWGPDAGPKFSHQQVEPATRAVAASHPAGGPPLRDDPGGSEINIDELDWIEPSGSKHR